MLAKEHRKRHKVEIMDWCIRREHGFLGKIRSWIWQDPF